MMHNAEGCMKDFVKEQVWERLKHRKDMWCATRRKPLVNMDIYTKDWAFKVVGSIKWCDRAYHQLPLPSEELFLATRMADRTGSPSFTYTTPNTTPLWRKWADMMLTAKSIRIFQHPPTILQKTIRKLSIKATYKETISSQLVTMGATALCILTLGEGPILTTVVTGQKWKFEKYCQSTKTGPWKDDHQRRDEAINHLWHLSSTVLKPVLHALQDKLPKAKNPMVLYKGSRLQISMPCASP